MIRQSQWGNYHYSTPQGTPAHPSVVWRDGSIRYLPAADVTERTVEKLAALAGASQDEVLQTAGGAR